MSQTSTAPLSVLRDDVRALRAYPVPDSAGLVKLDMMENPYSLPSDLARALGERLGTVALNRYPPGEPSAFKRRLAARVALPDASAMLLGNGSDELIHLVILACARPGAVVLSPWPSFAMYRMSAGLDGCRFVDVALQADFRLDLPATLAAIGQHRPAVIFLSYPNNPTGNLFDRTAVEAILQTAPGIVVIDEAYLPFAQQTWMGALPRRPNLLVLRTLSKLGLAGLRLGYLCGAPTLIEQLDKVRPPFNVNVLTLAAVDFLLDHFEVLDAQAARLRADRDRLLVQLRAIAGIEVFDSAANFLLLRVANGADVFAKLRRQGILIKDVSGAHPLLQNCLRVTIGTTEENAQFVHALRGSI
ncbi:Histidinol-phosphate aminotransferase 1 [Burkholderiales bacterium]|nr:Histidinol-phosphate aminotransferase 1 [Burkholderiales bacterium]